MKKWEKPELLILVRGRPDDAVLVNCKTLGQAANPTVQDQGCWQFFDIGRGPECSVGCDANAPS